MPVHAVQRGHDRGAVFFDDHDYLEYLRCLREVAQEVGCAVHAYALMTNHVHLLLTPERVDSAGKLFQGIGRVYVRYINTTYGRRGSLWEGRYKSHLVDSQRYLLACMRYIEMNPVRAGMVASPADYRWTSYAANALGVDNAVLTPHEEYAALGGTADDRQAAYRQLFEHGVDRDERSAVRAALQTGTPLGNDRFKAQVEAMVGRKVGFASRGRPAARQ